MINIYRRLEESHCLRMCCATCNTALIRLLVLYQGTKFVAYLICKLLGYLTQYTLFKLKHFIIYDFLTSVINCFFWYVNPEREKIIMHFQYCFFYEEFQTGLMKLPISQKRMAADSRGHACLT